MTFQTVDVLDRYFQSVEELPVPDGEQERRWFEEYENLKPGPKRARLKGIIAHGYLRFVIKAALKRSKDRQVLIDLIGEGNSGLLEAIDKFEVQRGWRFLTYAAWWINVRMQAFQHGNRAVHIPQQILKAQRAKKRKEDVEMAKGLRTSYSFVEVSVTDIEKVSVAASPEETEVSSGKMMEVLKNAGLTRRESLVLTWFYGLRGGVAKNLDEIANLLHLVEGGTPSRESIRELKDDAVDALRAHMASTGIEGVWEL